MKDAPSSRGIRDIGDRQIKMTSSVCPACLRVIPAEIARRGGKVFMDKECPEHGRYSTLIFDDADLYEKWTAQESHAECACGVGAVDTRGCPYSCGICAEHEGEACTVLFHITDACNLRCPVCLADCDGVVDGNGASSGGYDVIKGFGSLELADIQRMYQACLDKQTIPPVQLSGGEPTMRENLPAIIRLGKQMGIPYIQVNTNGIRLAQQPGYAKLLVESGLDLVYLQFDGMDDKVYRTLRGQDLLDVKKAAVRNCARAGLGVLLVVTLYPGVNTGQLGDIVGFAKANMPIVKGIHIQPVSFFGRHTVSNDDDHGLTFPKVFDLLEEQTGGEVNRTAVVPRHKADAHCSFSSVYLLGCDGRLGPVTHASAEPMRKTVDEGADHFAVEAIDFTKKYWRSHLDTHGRRPVDFDKNTGCCCPAPPNRAALIDHLENYTLSISGMHFQDAHNLDIDRLKGCCVQVATPLGGFIPFCAYYLTADDGRRLYGPRGLQKGFEDVP